MYINIVNQDKFIQAVFKEAFGKVASECKMLRFRSANDSCNWLAQRDDLLYQRIKIDLRKIEPDGFLIHFSFSICWFAECPNCNSPFGLAGRLDDFASALSALGDLYFSSGWFKLGKVLDVECNATKRIIAYNKEFASRFLESLAGEVKGDVGAAMLAQFLPLKPGDTIEVAESKLKSVTLKSPLKYPLSKIMRQFISKSNGDKKWYFK